MREAKIDARGKRVKQNGKEEVVRSGGWKSEVGVSKKEI
jgi:hypothetical protein